MKKVNQKVQDDFSRKKKVLLEYLKQTNKQKKPYLKSFGLCFCGWITSYDLAKISSFIITWKQCLDLFLKSSEHQYKLFF